jgi:hypothetical protein
MERSEAARWPWLHEPSVACGWGSTAAERAAPFPCDRHVRGGQALFRAVDVGAAPGILFRWLCQLRAAPYSYDWIDNLGRPSPQALTPGLERLAIGQRVMTLFELADFEPDRHLTLVPLVPGMCGRLAVSYVVRPREGAASRVVVKLVVRWPGGAVAWPAHVLFACGDLVMMRRQLLNLKRLAERSAKEGR